MAGAFFQLPELNWVLCGDPSQPESQGAWRGKVSKNNLANGRFSSFLPEAYVVLENDFRSLCPVLKDFRARLRQATEEQVPAFIEEGRKLFTARAPFDTCIVLSHAKRLKIRIQSACRPQGPPVCVQSRAIFVYW